MARGTKTTDFLKECMADALLKLIKDKDIDKGSEETYHPHGTVLPDLQKQIKQPRQYSEIFQ